MTEVRDPFGADTFTVTDAEVRAGRALPDVDVQSRAERDRELTLLLGLLGLGVGFGLAWLPLGLIVPSLIVTAIGIWSRGGAR